MRYCKDCGESIEAHAYGSLPLLVVREINARARNPREARARVRFASRECPITQVRADNGIPVYRAIREPDDSLERAA
jgi:hypothetical protein